MGIVFGIGPNMFIIGLPVVKMAQQEVMIATAALAEGDQVVGIKLQVRVKMEGLDVMDLDPSPFITTYHAGWFTKQMFFFDMSPKRTAFDTMFDRSHGPVIGFFEKSFPVFYDLMFGMLQGPAMLKRMAMMPVMFATFAQTYKQGCSQDKYYRCYKKKYHQRNIQCRNLSLKNSRIQLHAMDQFT